MKKDQNMDTEELKNTVETDEAGVGNLRHRAVLKTVGDTSDWVKRIVGAGIKPASGGWVPVETPVGTMSEADIGTLMVFGVLSACWRKYPGYLIDMNSEDGGVQGLLGRTDGRKYVEAFIQGRGEEARKELKEKGPWDEGSGEDKFLELTRSWNVDIDGEALFGESAFKGVGRRVIGLQGRLKRAGIVCADLARWASQGLIELRRGKRIDRITGKVADLTFNNYDKEMGTRPDRFEWSVKGRFLDVLLENSGVSCAVKGDPVLEETLKGLGEEAVAWVRTCEAEVYRRKLGVCLTGKKRTRQGVASLTATPPSKSGVSFKVVEEMVEKGLVQVSWPSYPGVRVYKVDGTKNGRRGLTFVQGGVEVDGEALVDGEGLNWVKGEVEKGSLELYRYRVVEWNGKLRRKIFKDLRGEVDVWEKQGEVEWRFGWDVLFAARNIDKDKVAAEENW